MSAAQDLLQLRLDFGHGGSLSVDLHLGSGRPGNGLEIVPDLVVVALLVAGELDGVELDLGGDDAVLLGVVLAGVEPEQGCKAEVLEILELIAEFPPFLKEIREMTQ